MTTSAAASWRVIVQIAVLAPIAQSFRIRQDDNAIDGVARYQLHQSRYGVRKTDAAGLDQ